MTIYSEIFKRFDEKLATLPPAKEPEKASMLDTVGSDLARLQKHGLFGAVGFASQSMTFGAADRIASKIGERYAMEEFRSSLLDQGLMLTDMSTPEEALWKLEDRKGNTRFINPKRELEGTYYRDAGDAIADLMGIPYTPDMKAVYDTARSIGIISNLGLTLDDPTKDRMKGMTYDALTLVESYMGRKRDKFDFRDSMSTGGLYMALGGKIEGTQALKDAIPEAAFIRQFMNTPFGRKALKDALSEGEMKWFLAASQSAKEGKLDQEAWRRKFNYDGQLSKALVRLQEEAVRLNWKPSGGTLLPEKNHLTMAFPVFEPRPKVVRPRSEELVDAAARGMARVGSAGAQAEAGFWGFDPIESGAAGWPYVPKTPQQREFEERRANLWRSRADFMWRLSKNPGLASQNEDIWSDALNLIGETIPYIAATSGAYVLAGPAGGFVVGSMVEGNMAYRNALDNGVDPELAKGIGVVVGIVSGAIESVGGTYAEEMIGLVSKKVSSKILQAGKTLAIGSIIEALEEGAQEVSQIVGEEVYRDVPWRERLTRTLGSMAGGAFVGGLMRSGSMSMRGALGKLQTRKEALSEEELRRLLDVLVEEEAKEAPFVEEAAPEVKPAEPTKPPIPGMDKNPYLKAYHDELGGMSLDRIKMDAQQGVRLAQEALARIDPESAYGKDVIAPMNAKQGRRIGKLLNKHQLNQEGILRALQDATGESSLSLLSKAQADDFIRYLTDLHTSPKATEALSKGYSVAIDLNLPKGAMADIRKAAQSDEVLNNTMLYNQRIGGGPKNDEIPDIEGRRALHADDLVNAAGVRRRHVRKTEKAPSVQDMPNALSPWSSVRYALAQAELKLGIPLRRMFSNIVAKTVGMVQGDVKALEEAIKSVGLSTVGSPITHEESDQIAQWLFEEDEFEKDMLFREMTDKAQALAPKLHELLQGRSAMLVRWARWIKWDRAVREADAKMLKMREKGKKITQDKLRKLTEPARKARPYNAPMEALTEGRNARDLGQFLDWIQTQKWGTRKHYFMSEAETRDLLDLFPEGSIPEELEEQITRIGKLKEEVLPELMPRKGTGKPKGGNVITAILNHMNRVGVFAATFEDHLSFWNAFSQSKPTEADIANVRGLLGTAMGTHHVVTPSTRALRHLPKLFWRMYFLSPRRSLWFGTRNLHQNIAYGLSQLNAKEVMKASKDVTSALLRRKPLEANPWIEEDYANHWVSRMSQRKQLQHQFVLQKQGEIVNDFGNKAVGVIDYLGSYPMYTDEINRMIAWPILHQAAYNNVQSFMEGRKNAKQLWKDLDIGTLHISQRLELSRLLDEGNLRDFVMNYSEYKTENIHFRYETALRAIAEQDPASRLLMGLYTFPKGTFEILYQNGFKPFWQGMQSKNYTQAYKGARTILAGLVGSHAARWLLYGITGRHAYALWETIFAYSPITPGVSNLSDMLDKVNEIMWRASEEDQPIEKTVDSLFAALVGASEMAIPLADVMVNYYEEANDVYGVRLYSMLKKKLGDAFEAEYGRPFKAAERSNLEKFQHAFFGGAEKGAMAKERARLRRIERERSRLNPFD